MTRLVPWVAACVFAFPILANADCPLCLLGVCPTMVPVVVGQHDAAADLLACCGGDEIVSADSAADTALSGVAHDCSCLKAPNNSYSWLAQAKIAPLKNMLLRVPVADGEFVSRAMFVIDAAHSRVPPPHTFLDLSSLRI